MHRLIWSEAALAHIRRLCRFLAEKNLPAAQRAVKAIRQGVNMLVVHPQVGRVVEDMDEACRDWPVNFGDSGYVVRYRVDGKQVTILAIRHQKAAGF